MKKIFKNKKGFSLLELLITLAIFAILMVTTTALLVINLKAARKIKARSYAREETAFMFNVLKKDIRNANSVVYDSGNQTLMVTLQDQYDPSINRIYTWEFDEDSIVRKEGSNTNYRMPEDIIINNTPLVKKVVSQSGSNIVLLLHVEAWTTGMADDNNGEHIYVTKEVIVSTRNYDF